MLKTVLSYFISQCVAKCSHITAVCQNQFQKLQNKYSPRRAYDEANLTNQTYPSGLIKKSNNLMYAAEGSICHTYLEAGCTKTLTQLGQLLGQVFAVLDQLVHVVAGLLQTDS